MLRSPDGRERTLAVPAGAAKATVGPLDRVGVWTVLLGAAVVPVTPGPTEGPRPVRPASSSPSCRATWPIVARATCGPAEGLPDRPANLAAGLAVRPIWYYLLASAWVLTCWEWFLYQRRWID